MAKLSDGQREVFAPQSARWEDRASSGPISVVLEEGEEVRWIYDGERVVGYDIIKVNERGVRVDF
jgi:Ni,Fe-hydrogenase III large subunit